MIGNEVRRESRLMVDVSGGHFVFPTRDVASCPREFNLSL